MKAAIFAWTILFCAATAWAATIAPPPTPEPITAHEASHRPAVQGKATPIDWALLAADASFRALDVYSTRRMLQMGFHEYFLPRSVADHYDSMAGFSAGMVAANWFVGRELRRHGKRRLARVLTGMDAASTGYWATHNLFLGNLSHGRPVLHDGTLRR